MAIDSYIKFDKPGNGAVKIDGESQDTDLPGDKGWSVIHNVTFGSENVANVSTSSGGSGAGKLKFKEFSVAKHVDKASPPLFTAICTGGHYGEVTLVCRKQTGTTNKPFLTYTFAEVKVQSIDIALADDDEAPKEDVKFTYAAMKIEYATQDAGGKVGTPLIAQWSQTKNAPVLQA